MVAYTCSVKCDKGSCRDLGQHVLDEGPSELGRWHSMSRRQEGDTGRYLYTSLITVMFYDILVGGYLWYFSLNFLLCKKYFTIINMYMTQSM